jgi:hypothetical protein
LQLLPLQQLQAATAASHASPQLVQLRKIQVEASCLFIAYQATLKGLIGSFRHSFVVKPHTRQQLSGLIHLARALQVPSVVAEGLIR